MPTAAHIIYIPAILVLGLILGFIWGARATREAIALEEKRAAERAERKAARAAAKAAQQATPGGEPPPSQPPSQG